MAFRLIYWSNINILINQDCLFITNAVDIAGIENTVSVEDIDYIVDIVDIVDTEDIVDIEDTAQIADIVEIDCNGNYDYRDYSYDGYFGDPIHYQNLQILHRVHRGFHTLHQVQPDFHILHQVHLDYHILLNQWLKALNLKEYYIKYSNN